jgi:two-component system chemotaxis sensor kinase CheA
MSIDNDQAFIEEIQRDFLEETTFLLEQCEESYLKLEKPENRAEELGKIFRLAHSMKGAGASVGFLDLSAFAHVVEDCLTILRVTPELVSSDIISLLLRSGDAFKIRVKMLKEKSTEPWDVRALTEEVKAATLALGGAGIATKEAPAPLVTPVTPSSAPAAAVTPVAASSASPAPAAPPADDHAAPASGGAQSSAPRPGQKQSSSVKVDTDRIDAVLDMVGELVVLKSQLTTETEAYRSNLRLNGLVSLIEKSIRDLQDKALGMRMTPLKSLFLKTQRVVRDLSVKLNKPVDFQMQGEDTEIDRTMVELLGDPLMHIARNALDHGIEKADRRQQAGKPPAGKITLIAQQMGGRVVVKISDDGGGIDREKILKKALEKGLVPQDRTPESISDQEVYQLIFAPGFSTAETVSDVSGRGVGMDVVKTNVEKLKGTIEIKTRLGQGSTFEISLPLTTSITDGMQVQAAGQPFILPLDGIRELVDFNESATTQMHDGNEVLNVRGKLLPIIDLDMALGYASERVSGAEKTIVVVEGNRGIRAIRVDAVLGQVQVVLKTLGDYFSASRGIAGAAIMGDGKVALVLDIDNIESKESRAA